MPWWSRAGLALGLGLLVVAVGGILLAVYFQRFLVSLAALSVAYRILRHRYFPVSRKEPK